MTEIKMTIKEIRKRDGRIVKFEKEKIVEAIWKAAKSIGGKDRNLSEKLAEEVVELLTEKFDKEIPGVEQVQDLVEKVLIENGHAQTAKAYILYRKQHEDIRRLKGLFESIEIVDRYINKRDWRVRENANMTYSLQGLNNYISSLIVGQYWLHKIYSKRVRDAHNSGDFHIHDLGTLGPYCIGWDLNDLLISGLTGVAGKVSAKPAKHFRVALGQIVNFFYTLQGEAAGAQALSNFDTLLAPFIRYDKLSYEVVKQAMQEFLFNMNVPTRVGFQCMSEDTEILTPDGWKTYDEIKVGDKIKTFNIEKGGIEDQKVKKLFKKHYSGTMYNLKNRIQDQMVSPRHRVVRKKFNSNRYCLEPIEDIIKIKSPAILPIAAKNSKEDADISDEQIKLMAWIIGEGSIEKPGKHRCCYRVSIYQSKIKNKKNYEEIKKLLDHFGLEYSEHTQYGLGKPVQRIRLDAKSSREIHKWFSKENVGFIPKILLHLSQRQSRLFIETYVKAEGFEDCKIATSDIAILNDLQAIASNAGYGSTVLERKPTIGTKTIYVLRLIKHENTYVNEIKKVNYSGTIWCPNTKNETVIARRNGKVFITGNTPFTNITLDLHVPSYLENQGVIIGGEMQKERYADFHEEMAMLNRAFAEVMTEGDANNRLFTFPIPTYNITKNFDWDNRDYEPIWEMTAKYGIPYFSNFVNSDMKPEDARSMCCRLRLDTRELRKRGGGLFGANPLTGSVGVVTINMPRIAYLSRNEDEFLERLGLLMDIAKESLETKRKVLEKFIENGLYPYSKFYLRSIKQRFREYWKNHFSTIGLVGMNEACLNLLGDEFDIGTVEGHSFALKVLEFMRRRIEDYQLETQNIYNLEATPAEGTSYRLAKIDKKKYPDIVVANETSLKEGNVEPYYTNSTQLPVDKYTDNLLNALEIEDDLQSKYTGGTVFHVFVGEAAPTPKIVRDLARKITDNLKLPYFTITPTFSICPVHGYIFGEHKLCPKCQEEGKKVECEVYSRIVGYLRPVSQWNAGKQAEFKERKTFG